MGAQIHSPALDHLLAFSNIRKTHDRVYAAAFSKDERKSIERLRVPNHFAPPLVERDE